MFSSVSMSITRSRAPGRVLSICLPCRMPPKSTSNPRASLPRSAVRRVSPQPRRPPEHPRASPFKLTPLPRRPIRADHQLPGQAPPSLPLHPSFKYLYPREARTSRVTRKAENRQGPPNPSRAPQSSAGAPKTPAEPPKAQQGPQTPAEPPNPSRAPKEG